MYTNQTIHKPAGVNVVGTSLVRVEPDRAVLRIGIKRLSPHPRDSFSICRAASEQVRACLEEAKVPSANIHISNLKLEQRWERPYTSEAKLLGYEAALSLQVTLQDTAYEALLGELIDAGANVVEGVSFVSSRLAELRAQARRLAVRKAKEKAALYAEAAGLSIGRALHIEDLNPDQLRGHESHSASAPGLAEDEDGGAARPGTISVGAAVLMCFELLG